MDRKESQSVEQDYLNILLFDAVKTDMIGIAKEAINSGADIDYVNANGMFPLYNAYANGKITQMKLLLSYGANIHKQYNGSTILDYEARKLIANIEIIELLIKHDIGFEESIDHKTLGNILLHVTRKNNKNFLLWLLANTNMNINFQNDKGKTALSMAFSRKHIELAMILLENDADINVQDKKGGTILIRSIMTHEYDLASILIPYEKIKLDLQDIDGDTALHIACANDKGCIIYQLLNEGANPMLKNNEGGIPQEYCHKDESAWIFKIYGRKKDLSMQNEKNYNFFKVPDILAPIKIGYVNSSCSYQKYDKMFGIWKKMKKVPNSIKCEHVDELIPYHVYYSEGKEILVRFDFIWDQKGFSIYKLYK